MLVHLAITDNWIEPDPRVDAVRGQTALQRGPVVYCAEALSEIADPVSLDLVAVIDTHTRTTIDVVGPNSHSTTAHSRTVQGILRQMPDTPGWPYHSRPRPSTDPVTIPLVPYYSWGNHGPSTMRIWLPKVSPAGPTRADGDT